MAGLNLSREEALRIKKRIQAEIVFKLIGGEQPNTKGFPKSLVGLAYRELMQKKIVVRRLRYELRKRFSPNEIGQLKLPL